MLMPPARQQPGGGEGRGGRVRGRRGVFTWCTRGVGSGLREGSVRSPGTKMEQCRNSLAGRHGKRASSSAGASLLPLFHFLFLPLARARQSGSPPFTSRDQPSDIATVTPSARFACQTWDWFLRDISSLLGPTPSLLPKTQKWNKNKYCQILLHPNQNESGRMLEEERWPKNLLNKDRLLVSFFNTSSLQDKKKKSIWPAVTDFLLNYQTILSFLSKM